MHFYNVGGDSSGYAGTASRLMTPLGLTEVEEQQLVAFLESLTGAPVDPAIACDPRPEATADRCGGP